jgi:hypothetical protein
MGKKTDELQRQVDELRGEMVGLRKRVRDLEGKPPPFTIDPWVKPAPYRQYPDQTFPAPYIPPTIWCNVGSSRSV